MSLKTMNFPPVTVRWLNWEVSGYPQGCSHVSKIGVSTFQSLQMYNYSGHRRRGDKNGEGISPSPADQGSERASLSSPSWVWGRAPAVSDLGAFRVQFCATSHIFYSAFNSCLETVYSYTPLLASRCDVLLKFFWCWRTPQLKFLGCPLQTHGGSVTGCLVANSEWFPSSDVVLTG